MTIDRIQSKGGSKLIIMFTHFMLPTRQTVSECLFSILSPVCCSVETFDPNLAVVSLVYLTCCMVLKGQLLLSESVVFGTLTDIQSHSLIMALVQVLF